jgi:dTDP-glucose 4,6-dehydratase
MEDAALLPNSPYSASKAGADMLVRAYNRTYGMDTIITRASNNYGPRQYAEKVIPVFIKNLLQGKKVPLYADGANIREWLYVDDTAKGIDAAFHKGKSGEIYNLGGTVSFTNLEMTKKLLSLLGKDESSIEHVADRPGHDFRYAIDSSKAERELGWKANTSFEDGIQKTIVFYRERFGV